MRAKSAACRSSEPSALGEVQVVVEIFGKYEMRTFCVITNRSADYIGQVCVMIRSDLRDLVHQVTTDALAQMDRAMVRDQIATNDRQLACARTQSQERQDYPERDGGRGQLCLGELPQHDVPGAPGGCESVCSALSDDLDVHVVYDVSHTIAKVETHLIDGKPKKLLTRLHARADGAGSTGRLNPRREPQDRDGGDTRVLQEREPRH